MAEIRFVGGCADGTVLDVQKIGGHYPPVMYMAKPLSLAELDELRIDDITSWKPPEDVYYLRGDEYVFDRTVSYTP